MKKGLPRLIIYTKDVVKITGRSVRYARVIMKRVKSFYNKSSSDLITIMEFCSFMKMEEAVVRAYLDE